MKRVPQPVHGLLACLALAACAPAPEPSAPPLEWPPPPETPYLRVVGTAQDGGFPHVGCDGPRCRRARSEPGVARLVASVALVPQPGEVWLIDATPDLRAQLDRLAADRRPPEGATDRRPIDGVLLTHAHLGHYTGLAYLGFEATNIQDLPLVATPAMTAFLRTNGPWSQLFELGNVRPLPLSPGESRGIGGGIRVEPFQVPHRDEFADTVGWLIEGPNRTVLYVPDADHWSDWPVPFDDLLDRADVALLDATFFSDDELPDRIAAKIPHPRIRSSMDRLEDRVQAGLEVVFTHLNHSNPAIVVGSPEHAEIERRGFRVARDGELIGL